MASIVTEEYKCGYCLRPINKMVSPKVLQCNHLFCKACLETAVKISKYITCPVCRQKHTGDVNSLKDFQAPIALPKVVTCEYNCAVCEEKTTANVFCLTLQILMCTAHRKVNDDYVGMFKLSPHEYIDAVTYSESPHTYIRRKCESHRDEVVRLACDKCHKCMCTKCFGTKYCIDDSLDHQTNQLAAVAGDLSDRLRESCDALLAKIEHLLDQEKEAQMEACDLRDELDEMKNKIDQTLSKQIGELTGQAMALKAELDSYWEEVKLVMKPYTTALMTEKEQLEKMRASTNELLIRKPYQTIIEQYDGSMEEIHAYLSAEVAVKPVLRPCRKVVFKNTETVLAAALTQPIPKTLRLKKQYSTGERYQSVNWTSSGDIICGTNNAIIRHQKETLEIESRSSTGDDFPDVHEVRSLKKIVALKVKQDSPVCIEEFNLDLKHQRTLSAITGCELSYCKLFISPQEDEMIAVTDTAARVYAIDGSHRYDINLSDFGITKARAVHTLSTTHLLVLDRDSGLYKITREKEPALVWSCLDLGVAYGFCVQSELIYVACNEKKVIEVISLDGEKLRSLRHEGIKWPVGVAVSHDLLAVVDGRYGLKLFAFDQ